MKNRNFQSAFSLMEMMVVLLIVAIIAAATAPMVTKKMARTAGSGDSPWVFTGLNSNIAYNMGGRDNATVIIGNSSLPNGWNQNTRLFIDSGNNASHIAFGNGNTTPLLLTADPTNGRIGFSNATITNSSIAFGTGQTLDENCVGLVAIGVGAKAGGKNKYGKIADNAIAIGKNAQALDVDSISIGNNAQTMNSGCYDDTLGIVSGKNIAIGASAEAKDYSTIAIGYKAGTNDSGTSQSSDYAIAIGNEAKARGNRSIAIGNEAVVKYGDSNSVAIGTGARSLADHQIVLGTAGETVYIPGNLIVAGYSVLGINGSSRVFLNLSDSNGGNGICQVGSGRTQNNVLSVEGSRKTASGTGTSYSDALSWFSDRRLKNVGEKYTAGLEELKKLDFYHYTFKADKDNTPFVGVIAQDLQKVFPDAVTKDESGYLRIRIEDMFYAVINAVKELDVKVSQIVADVTGISSKVDEQQKVIEAQQQKIDELEKANADFEKRLAKLEKKNKKFEE